MPNYCNTSSYRKQFGIEMRSLESVLGLFLAWRVS